MILQVGTIHEIISLLFTDRHKSVDSTHVWDGKEYRHIIGNGTTSEKDIKIILRVRFNVVTQWSARNRELLEGCRRKQQQVRECRDSED